MTNAKIPIVTPTVLNKLAEMARRVDERRGVPILDHAIYVRRARRACRRASANDPPELSWIYPHTLRLTDFAKRHLSDPMPTGIFVRVPENRIIVHLGEAGHG